MKDFFPQMFVHSSVSINIFIPCYEKDFSESN